ncbi:MAG: hypothetical protein DI536_02575 [Archangium gephyra]|uniref:DUF748 domain-containing protein n=1 Tax=Archangium gephyra TaxID=48 RepID=A0A2W5TZW1_9BACT|nr:MAG: hypothetical protein DI536_02575 [Archangium gephyra]
MSAAKDRELLELQANEQRRKVLKLVEAVDAWRHPRRESKRLSPRALAAMTLTGVGVVGAIAAFLTGKKGPAKALLAASATVGGAGLALGVGPALASSRKLLPAPAMTPAMKELRQLEAHLPLPEQHGPVENKKRKHLGWWIFLGVVLLLVVGVRVALDPLATHFTQKGLDGLTGYKGTFSDVDVSIIPLEYRIENLRLVQDGTRVEDAVLFAKELKASSKWSDLLRFRVVASARADHAHFRMNLGETKAPREVKQAAKEGAEELERNDLDIGKTLEQILPFRVDRFELHDSEVTLTDVTDPKKPKIWLNDIEFVAENITSRQNLDQRAPLMVTGRATVQKTGVLKLLVVADLLDEKPAFTGQAQLIGLDLESLYQWAAAKAGLSPHGSVDVFVNFNSAKGGVGGDVKVMAKNLKVDPLEGKFSNAIKAAGANAAFSILKDEQKGQAVATTLPLRGSLEKPDAQIWPTIIGVLRNAFVDSLGWGFGDLPVPTASKKEGIIEQTVKGLDKKEEAPKAQPNGGN